MPRAGWVVPFSLMSTILAIAVPLAQGRSPHPLQYEQFDITNARLTRPFGVNASGQIVGLFRDATNANHGFLRHPDGTYAQIDYPDATFTNAAAINASGAVVGRWTDRDGFNHGYFRTLKETFRASIRNRRAS
jgi:probable HAF family extracellular repeat protein